MRNRIHWYRPRDNLFLVESHYYCYLLTFYCEPLERGAFFISVFVARVLCCSFSSHSPMPYGQNTSIYWVVLCWVSWDEAFEVNCPERRHGYIYFVLLLSEWVRLLPRQRRTCACVSVHQSNCGNVCDKSSGTLMCEKRKIFFSSGNDAIRASVAFTNTNTLVKLHTHRYTRQFYQRGDSVWPMNYWLLLLLLTMHTQQQKKKKRRRNNIPAQWNK